MPTPSWMMGADASRRGDLDGRGNLSQAALDSFCEFLLRVSNDQISYFGRWLHRYAGRRNRVFRHLEWRCEVTSPLDSYGLSQPVAGNQSCLKGSV